MKRLDVDGPTRSLCHDQLAAEDRERHFKAVLFADHACYPKPANRVPPEKLRTAMEGFPQGFRSWWIKGTDPKWIPVGYAAWHPISEATFELMKRGDRILEGRLVEVAHSTPPDRPLLYLFNYSVLAPLRGSDVARQLMQTLAAELRAHDPVGLAALTVSADGERVALRFGMERRGQLPSGDGIFTS